MSKIVIDFCIEDFNAEAKKLNAIRIAKNGKHYIKMDVIERKEATDWGTHFVKLHLNNDQKGIETILLGSGREFKYQSDKADPNAPTLETGEIAEAEVVTEAPKGDGLPF